MLKIKDEIDLKELEKFGFVFDKEGLFQCYEYYDDLHRMVMFITVDLRIVEYTVQSVETENMLDVLFDLIQSGLVEKVEV